MSRQVPPCLLCIAQHLMSQAEEACNACEAWRSFPEPIQSDAKPRLWDVSIQRFRRVSELDEPLAIPREIPKDWHLPKLLTGHSVVNRYLQDPVGMTQQQCLTSTLHWSTAAAVYPGLDERQSTMLSDRPQTAPVQTVSVVFWTSKIYLNLPSWLGHSHGISKLPKKSCRLVIVLFQHSE